MERYNYEDKILNVMAHESNEHTHACTHAHTYENVNGFWARLARFGTLNNITNPHMTFLNPTMDSMITKDQKV